MSTVVLDTITGKSTATTITIGSTPVVSASANSMTIRGEGSAQTSIQQGLAKAWGLFNGTGTIAIRDSFNFSSIADTAVGRITVSINADMNSINYSISAQSSLNDTVGDSSTYNVECSSRAAGSYEMATYSVNNYQDDAYIDTAVHGDLA